MNKNEMKWYIADAIVFIVFSVIAFVTPFEKNGVFIIGYLFGVIAITTQIYFLKISFTQGVAVKSKLYGFPIGKLGVIYLVLQMGISVVEFVIAKFLPIWVAVIVNVLLLAFAVIGSIAADVMSNEIVRQDVQIKTDIKNIRSLQSQTASFVGMCKDADIKQQLQDLADDFKYCDPVSSEDTQEMEAELKCLVNEIQRALVDGDMKSVESFCVHAKASLADRNRVCKLEK